MEQELGLNAGGWIFIVVAWGFIWALTIFCFKRVLSTHGDKK
jgi:glycerol uptake facilitator-like aquaporin